MESQDIEQALRQLQQAQNDPQTLTLTTAQIACAQLHPELFTVLEAAAIPHWFDADIIASLLQTDANNANQWIERLIQLPMVESYASRQAWNVHEATRLTLRGTLAKTDPERFKTLTRQCADYFSGSEEAQRIEHIYHQLAVAETGADKQLLDLYNNWRSAGRYDAQQALALVLEELLRSDLLNGVILARTLVIRGWIRGSRMPLFQADAQARQAIDLFIKAKDEYGAVDAHQWLGDTLKTEGNLKEALHEFRAGMEIMQRLTEQDPNNCDWQRDLSALHLNIGSVLRDQDNLAEALKEYRAGSDILRRLSECDPDNIDRLRDLSVSHNCVGRVLQAQNDLAGALMEYQADIYIMRRLTERAPDNNDWQRELSISHNCIGSVQQAQGNLAGALKEYRAYMDIMRLLTKRDPNNSDWQRELSVSHNNVGGILQAQGDLPGALEEYKTSMNIMRRLSELDPDNSDWQSDFSLSHYSVASILEAQNLLAEALAHREADLAITERLAQLEPTNAQWQQDLQTSRQALAALKQRIQETKKP